jgi:hypothetical protein
MSGADYLVTRVRAHAADDDCDRDDDDDDAANTADDDRSGDDEDDHGSVSMAEARSVALSLHAFVRQEASE